jgi:hypothetical protein
LSAAHCAFQNLNAKAQRREGRKEDFAFLCALRVFALDVGFLA